MSTIPMEWTVLERLLLAQAVHKYGEDDWTQVARTLKQHPLLHGQARLEAFNQKNCSLQYYLMLEDMDNESRRQNKPPNAIASQDIPKVVKLARQLYFQRVDELNKAIKQDEDRFMAVLSEIDQIKSGTMDQELTNLANDQQDSLTLPNEGKMAETVDEMAQHGVDTQESTDSKVMVAGDNTSFDDTTKELTPTPETQLTMETTTTINIPQQQSKEGADITQIPGSPLRQATETTPTPSTNMNDTDIPSKTNTLQPADSSTIDQSTDTTTDDLSVPIQGDQNKDQIMTTNQKQIGMEENNTGHDLDTTLDGNVNNLPHDGQETDATTTDDTPAIEAPQSMGLGTKRPSDGNESSMEQEPLFESASKRPRLDQLLADCSPSSPVTTFDHQDMGSIVGNNITTTTTTTATATIATITDNDTSNEISQTIETKPTELDSNSQQPYIPDVTAVSPYPITKTSPQAPSTSILVSSQQPSPSDQSVLQSTSEWVSKPAPELVSREPSPDLAVDPAKQILEAYKSTDEKKPSTEPTVFDQGEKPWTTDGEDMDGTESVTESDSNTATPTTINNSTPTPDKRRSGSIGINKDDPRQKSWQKHINLLWRDIANHKNGTMFMNPIKEIQAPLYYDVVKHPLDLKTIKNRIRDGTIRTTVEFERDVVLMLANSLMYNKEGTEIYQMALEMLQDVTEQIKIFKTAYGDSSAHTRSPSVLSNDQQKGQHE